MVVELPVPNTRWQVLHDIGQLNSMYAENLT